MATPFHMVSDLRPVYLPGVAQAEPLIGHFHLPAIPNDLVDVSNGKFMGKTDLGDGYTRWDWHIQYPINNYSVSLNIGHYTHFSDEVDGRTLDFYCLPGNLEKARAQFSQAKTMMQAFQKYIGPYPFRKDGYKLIEVPYSGMEHQSAVTYGNRFANGYLERDWTGVRISPRFDFIIIHESAHEWWANSITYKDIADMWIHESFANYSENLFVEYFYGNQAGKEYARGTRKNIWNDSPIIGFYDVNHEGSGDMYPKGGNMLHTLRQIVNDDKKWREILRGINREFYHQVVTGAQVEKFMSEKTGIDLQSFFDQYLRDIRIPVFEYYIKDRELIFRWNNCVKGFDMPLKVYVSGKPLNIKPKGTFSTVMLDTSSAEIKVDPGYYVGVLNITGN